MFVCDSYGYKEWLNDSPEEAKKLIFPTEGEKCKWGRLIVNWNEKVPHSSESIEHVYAFCINRQTGEIYLDCSKKKIYAKLLVNLVARPFTTVAKTIYHLVFPISIAYICYKIIKESGEQSREKIARKCLNASVCSIIDIVRTPAYGVAMMVVLAVGVLIGPLVTPLKSEAMYDFREAMGKLVKGLYRSEDFVHDDPLPCVQPYKHMDKFVDAQDFTPNDDTVYGCEATSIEKALMDFVRVNVKYYRNHYVICNNPFRRMREGERYVSTVYDPKWKTLNK